MAIWKKVFTLEQLNEMGKDCAIGHLGIEISAYGLHDLFQLCLLEI